MKTTWNDLSIKDKLAMSSACLAFMAGWVLTGLACFVPLLISEQGILWILGQSLIYTASVFGISAYFKSETVQMKNDVARHLERVERMQLERMKIKNGMDVDEIPEDEE